MLVQLSPWKTLQTSIKSQKSTRRRKRDESKGNQFPVAVSFITTSTRKALQKMRQHSSELSDSIPLLALTSDHQITVVGQSKEHSYEEYTSLKYASRPGNAGSFFAPSTTRSATTTQQIPSIFDVKNDRVYALQQSNTRLCSWNSLRSSGPDEKGSLKVELSQPALSLALLPMHKGVIYGTCLDGSIFVARVVEDSANGEALSVEYLPTKQPDGYLNIGTCAEVSHGQEMASGQKRKASEINGNSVVTFYQAFSKDESVKLLRLEATCERYSKNGRLVIAESLSHQSTSIDLEQSNLDSKAKLDRVQLLISYSGSIPKAALLYTYVDSLSNKSNYCAAVSLASGKLSHFPILLPSTTKQYGLITEMLLAVGTKEEIFVYDLQAGSVLQSIDIRPILGESESDWILSTNSKFSTIAVMHMTDDGVKASFSIVSLEGSKIPLSGLSLASRLASSVQVQDKLEANREILVTNNLVETEEVVDSIRPSAILEDSIQRALDTLDETRSAIMSTKKGKGDSVFLQTFESCASSLMDKTKGYDNPQDALPCNGKVLNGHKKRKSNGVNGVNGISMKPACLTPASLPQSFIDGALKIVLKVLVADGEGKSIASARVEAGLILRELVKSGKVSARLHFEIIDSESTKEQILETTLRRLESSNKKGQRIFSPVDLILGMLQWCPDLSELQLVALLNYMLRRALPDDIAEAIMEAKIGIKHPYKKVCHNYFTVRDRPVKSSKKDGNADLELLANRLITAGTTFVLQKIIAYSECNEAMLRAALEEGLSNGQSAIILAKILSNLVLTSTNEISKGKAINHNRVKTTCQWISALSESFQDELSEATTPAGESLFLFLLESVKNATKYSQVVISLHDDFTRSSMQRESIAKKSGLKETPFKRDEDLPGYSIDHLVF